MAMKHMNPFDELDALSSIEERAERLCALRDAAFEVRAARAELAQVPRVVRLLKLPGYQRASKRLAAAMAASNGAKRDLANGPTIEQVEQARVTVACFEAQWAERQQQRRLLKQPSASALKAPAELELVPLNAPVVPLGGGAAASGAVGGDEGSSGSGSGRAAGGGAGQGQAPRAVPDDDDDASASAPLPRPRRG